MAKIKDIEEIKVRKVNDGYYECSTMYGGYYRHRYYLGYTRTKARNAFKRAIERGEV